MQDFTQIPSTRITTAYRYIPVYFETMVHYWAFSKED